MRTHVLFLLISIPLVFTGCSNVNTRPVIDGKQVKGVNLKNELSIPENSAHTQFQYGRQVPAVNHFDTYCKFEVNTVSEQPQSVAADYFEIVGVGNRILIDDVTGISAILSSDRGCEDPFYYETSLRLRSDKQPNARALICLNVGINCGAGYRFLHAAEMQAILGPIFSWKLED